MRWPLSPGLRYSLHRRGETETMPLALNIGKCTLLGNYRENNEDSIEAKQFPDMTVRDNADGHIGELLGLD